MYNASKQSHFVSFTWFLFVFLILIFRFDPFTLHTVGLGLDNSWMTALAWATENHLQFGSDVVFTGGPLSGIYTRVFQTQSPFYVVYISVCICVFVSLSLYILIENDNNFKLNVYILCLVLSTFYFSVDAILLSVPLITYFVSNRPNSKLSFALRLLGSFLTGTIILSKFSVAPIGVFSVIVVDIISMLRRQFPFSSLLLLCGFISGFYVSGQSLSQVGPYLAGSLDTTFGYSSAMNILPKWYRLVETFLWVLLGALLLTRLLLHYCGVIYSEPRLEKIGGIFVTAAFLFVSFKAGFVRHDIHSLYAWSSLVIVSLSWLYITGRDKQSHRSTVRITCTLVLLSSIIISNILLVSKKHAKAYPMPSHIIEMASREAVTASTFILSPSTWFSNNVRERKNVYSVVRSLSPMPPVNGTIDMIPSNQVALIAHGLNYRPRPTIQEYTTYNSDLIRRNRLYYEGKGAAEYLVFSPGSIDGRHPASAEGALWPLFLGKYEPYMLLDQNLVLKRRVSPVNVITELPNSETTRFGREILLPTNDAPIFAKVHFQPTLLGRLLDLSYQTPFLKIRVTYLDGVEETFRIIPGMSGDGMLISPMISNAKEYEILALGRASHDTLRFAKSIYFPQSLLSNIAYRDEIAVDFFEVDTTALNQSVR